MRKFLLVTVSLLLSLSGYAEDLTTTDGKTYRNISVQKVTKRGISIRHKNGATVVPFSKLPEDFRRKYASQEGKFAKDATDKLARKADEQVLNKISLALNEIIVCEVHDNFLVCRYWWDDRCIFCIVLDVPEMKNLATGDALKHNRALIDNSKHPKHHYVLFSRTDEVLGEYVPSKGKKEIFGHRQKHKITYYWGNCSRCRQNTQEKTDLESIKKLINELNKKECLSILNVIPPAVVLYDTGKKQILGSNTVRIYTYSKTKALKIIHPLKKLTITGSFDGTGEFRIAEDTITYHHESCDQPNNVCVNGEEWKDITKPFILQGWIPENGATFRKISGRDKAEFRSKQGFYVIRVDDGSNGAGDYEIELSF